MLTKFKNIEPVTVNNLRGGNGTCTLYKLQDLPKQYNMFAKIVTMEYKEKNNTAVGTIIPTDNPKNAVISINKISITTFITTIINENESNSILIGLKR